MHSPFTTPAALGGRSRTVGQTAIVSRALVWVASSFRKAVCASFSSLKNNLTRTASPFFLLFVIILVTLLSADLYKGTAFSGEVLADKLGYSQQSETDSLTIRLEDCIASSPTGMMKRIGCDPRLPSQAPAVQISRDIQKSNASNIFIVAERDERFPADMDQVDPMSFVRFTNRVLLDGTRSADYPFDQTKGPYWLFIYFGADHSTPARWTVDELRRNKNVITVTVSENLRNKVSDDRVPYFLWAPLGDLPSDSYELRVVDSKTNSVWFSRKTRLKAHR